MEGINFTANIAVDPIFDESYASGDGTDSASGRSVYSMDSTSVAKSIYEYRYEHGRRYHAYKEGKYMFPNDEREQERLDIVHHAFLLLLDGELHLAPIGPNPERILDVGTGTGIWAIDMAEKYPSAQVIGTDLSPIQPSWVPQNVRFEIDDAESPWLFEKASFDLIHIRHLMGAIKDWKQFIAEAFKFVKPGGYIEISEYEMKLFSDDGTLNEHSTLMKWYDLVDRATAAVGRDFRIAPHIAPILADTGFVDVHHQLYKLPIGTWAADPKLKEIGAFSLLGAEDGFEGIGIKLFTHVCGMTFAESKELIAEAKRSVMNWRVHSYCKQHIYYARKPLDEVR